MGFPRTPTVVVREHGCTLATISLAFINNLHKLLVRQLSLPSVGLQEVKYD
jgi:hypothetical protein